MEDWSEGGEQSHPLNHLPEHWVKRLTRKEAKGAKSNHTVKMMLDKEHQEKVVKWTRTKVARDFKRQSLRNGLFITI